MSGKFKHIQVIANPAAGRDEPVLSILNRVFREHEVEWDLRITHKMGDGERLAKEAIAAGADCVVSYGGDGTVMDVAAGMINSGVAFGVLPGGTGNAVAGALKLPLTTEAAARLIASGDHDLHTYDAAESDGRVYVLRADIGILAETMDNVDRSSKDRFGILAYAVSLMKGITAPREIQFKLTVDGEVIELTGAGCMVLNFDNIGTINRSIAQNVAPDDGMMDVFILKNDARSIVQTLASLADLVDYESLFGRYKGKVITVETDEPLNVMFDGDTDDEIQTPATFTTIPGALNIIVPKAADAPTAETN